MNVLLDWTTAAVTLNVLTPLEVLPADVALALQEITQFAVVGIVQFLALTSTPTPTPTTPNDYSIIVPW